MRVTFYVKEEVIRGTQKDYVDRGDFTFSVDGDCPSACLKTARVRLKDRLKRAFSGGGGLVLAVNLTSRQRGHCIISAAPLPAPQMVIQRRGQGRMG